MQKSNLIFVIARTALLFNKILTQTIILNANIQVWKLILCKFKLITTIKITHLICCHWYNFFSIPLYNRQIVELIVPSCVLQLHAFLQAGFFSQKCMPSYSCNLFSCLCNPCLLYATLLLFCLFHSLVSTTQRLWTGVGYRVCTYICQQYIM